MGGSAADGLFLGEIVEEAIGKLSSAFLDGGWRLPFPILSTFSTWMSESKKDLAFAFNYFEGARTAELCDPKYRAAGDSWSVGIVDPSSGTFIDTSSVSPDGGISDSGSDSGIDSSAPTK